MLQGKCNPLLFVLFKRELAVETKGTSDNPTWEIKLQISADTANTTLPQVLEGYSAELPLAGQSGRWEIPWLDDAGRATRYEESQLPWQRDAFAELISARRHKRQLWNGVSPSLHLFPAHAVATAALGNYLCCRELPRSALEAPGSSAVSFSTSCVSGVPLMLWN